ncbi:hypothetical protein BJF86_09580 [Serinicoccus sp. CNJ-927]|nr:hypothetical protein BJF86_09580 [Serinicoccus sp. CNJ-927]
MVLPSGARLLGYKEHDLWFDISGPVAYEVVAGGPDTSFGTCMKVTWAGVGDVVAAVEIGRIGGSHSRLALGAPGANELRDDRQVEATLYGGGIPSVVDHPFYGQSLWFFDSNKDVTYGVYLGIDEADLPAALFFDATSVARYWEKAFYEDDDEGGDDYDQVYLPWPREATEFHSSSKEA